MRRDLESNLKRVSPSISSWLRLICRKKLRSLPKKLRKRWMLKRKLMKLKLRLPRLLLPKKKLRTLASVKRLPRRRLPKLRHRKL